MNRFSECNLSADSEKNNKRFDLEGSCLLDYAEYSMECNGLYNKIILEVRDVNNHEERTHRPTC